MAKSEIRNSKFSHPLAGFLQLLDLAFHQFALDGAHLVQKHDAVAVIGIVLHASLSQFHAVYFKVIAINVLRTNYRSQVSLNRSKDSGERKTALFTGLRALDTQHFR